MNETILSDHLLETLTELYLLAGSEEIKNPELFKDNKSCQIRFLKIKAMQKALNIECDLYSLTTGRFIKDINRYNDIEQRFKMDKYIKKYGDRFIQKTPEKLIDVAQFDFSKMFEFKMAAEKVINYWRRTNIGYPPYMIALENTGKIIKGLKKDIIPLNKKLNYYINPENKNFDLNELIEKYSYPKENLTNTDEDELF